MVDYNLVKDCLICRKKFTVPKKDFKRVYCSVCQKRIKELRWENLEEILIENGVRAI